MAIYADSKSCTLPFCSQQTWLRSELVEKQARDSLPNLSNTNLYRAGRNPICSWWGTQYGISAVIAHLSGQCSTPTLCYLDSQRKLSPSLSSVSWNNFECDHYLGISGFQCWRFALTSVWNQRRWGNIPFKYFGLSTPHCGGCDVILVVSLYFY